MSEAQSEVLIFAVALLVCLVVGISIGRTDDVNDERLRLWNMEQAKMRRGRGESEAHWDARQAKAHREFDEIWRAPWGKTLRGALMGFAVAVGLYALRACA